MVEWWNGGMVEWWNGGVAENENTERMSGHVARTARTKTLKRLTHSSPRR